MKLFLMLLLAASGGLACAQTNAPAVNTSTNAPEPQTVIDSKHWYLDGIKNQMVYQGNVVATDAQSTLHCGQLTVDLPPGGGHPTNIVALTNVVIVNIDEKGQTNTATADKAVYAYSVLNAVTNEIVTFTRFTSDDTMPKVENAQVIFTGEPLVFNLTTKQYSGSDFRTIFKQSPGSGHGTNASPLNFLK